MNYTTVFLAIVVIALVTLWWWRNNNSPAARANLSETIAQGKAFLEENSQREEVISLPSGQQYEVIKEGTCLLYTSPSPRDRG